MTFWDGSRWTDDPHDRRTSTASRSRRRSLRDWLATIPIALLVPALIVPMVAVRANAASLSVTGVAIAEGQLSLTGRGLPPRQWIQIAWDGSTVGMPGVRTSSKGGLAAKITVPQGTAAGTHSVSALLGLSGSRSGGDRKLSRLDLASPLAVVSVEVVGSATAAPDPTPAGTPTPAETPAVTQPAATPTPPDPSLPPAPTVAPSVAPSVAPTLAPTVAPAPTSTPTRAPTMAPTTTPAPTAPPTAPPAPTAAPTPAPTAPPPAPVGVNVRDYGARGDGVTNDTAAFNAAQEAARAGSKVVYVPNGTYALTRFLPAAGITLRGQARASTVLARFGLGVHAAGGFIHVTAPDVTISDLTIRGTGKRLTSAATGQGDDILINAIGANRLSVLRVSLVDAQGCGIQTENASGMLFEDVSITNTFVRDNGYHGVALWPYHGTVQSTFRRITIDGADYAGIMIDAGTTVGTAASVDDNVFTDIVIRNAARYHILGGGVGAGWMFTGGTRNVVTRYEITDIPQGSALAFGSDQSGIGSTLNTLTTGVVARISSGIVAGFGPGATGNTFNGGSGGGYLAGSYAGNTFIDWPGLIP